jgi:hypothetical protein
MPALHKPPDQRIPRHNVLPLHLCKQPPRIGHRPTPHVHVHERALHEHVPRKPPFGHARVHLLPAPCTPSSCTRAHRAPERELVRPGSGPEREREQLQCLPRAPVLGVPGEHGCPGHDAPVRHPVEHLACSRDVAEACVEDDELGAEVEVRRSGGRDDPIVDGLALPEGVRADATLKQGGVERGGGLPAVGKAHFCARSSILHASLPAANAAISSGQWAPAPSGEWKHPQACPPARRRAPGNSSTCRCPVRLSPARGRTGTNRPTS